MGRRSVNGKRERGVEGRGADGESARGCRRVKDIFSEGSLGKGHWGSRFPGQNVLGLSTGLGGN